MEAARGATNKESEPRSSVSSVIPELAGANRSGKKRLLPEDQAETVESLAAEIQSVRLPDKEQAETGDVISADNPTGLVPDQPEAGRQDTADSSAGTSASSELTGIIADTQVEAGGGVSHHPDSGEVHSLSDSDPDQTSEMSDTSEQDAAKTAAAQLAASETVEGDNDTDVVIIEPSPTNFNPSLMPKTTQSSVFTAVNTQAHSNRTRIWKLLAQMDSKVEELEELEQEKAEGDSDDEYTEELTKGLGEDMVKVKSCLNSHSEFSHNLQLMANYMMEIRQGVPEANKLRSYF